MFETIQRSAAAGLSGSQSVSEEPEREGLIRLTKLVEHLFRVPVAYMTFLNADLGVGSRIGSGTRYWEDLKGFPAEFCAPNALVWARASGCGEIRFAASAPLRASDELQLGALVIADVIPRPEFQQRDLEVLSELLTHWPESWSFVSWRMWRGLGVFDSGSRSQVPEYRQRHARHDHIQRCGWRQLIRK